MAEYATLVNGRIVPCGPMEWARWVEDNGNQRVISKTTIGSVTVSTVFLGINHGWNSGDLWFETMIFGGEHDQYQERYETIEQARQGHDVAVRLAFGDNVI